MFEIGAAWPSSQLKTVSVLVSWCVAKKAVDPQVWATRKLFRIGDTNFCAVTCPRPIESMGIRTTAAPADRPSGVKMFVVT
jgi:hypothetical protein